MAILADTHLLLWTAGQPKSRPAEARSLIGAPGQQRWFSAASLWEIAIKHALGRAGFKVDPRRLRRGLLDNDWRELALSGEHAVATVALPPIHKDPFDRMLLAQAQVEGFTLLTSDATVARYGEPARKV